MLLTSPAFIMASYLQGEGVVSTVSSGNTWPLYTGYMPDGSLIKTNLVAVYSTPGTKDGRLMADGTVIQHYGFRIRVRANDYNIGWAKIEEIASNLDTLKNETETVNGQNYTIKSVKRIGLVVPEGREQGTKERHMFVHDFESTIVIL